MTTVESTLNQPVPGLTSAGAGTTPPCTVNGSAMLKAKAAVCTAAPDRRTRLRPCRTIHTLPECLVRADTADLQLEEEVQVVLRTILVEGPRLSRVQSVVLQRRIV